uniref:Uncharacterized protein n=1 Tax=Oryza meridionalis TaxID=40149 RepID=A0A0E0E7B4_9ORYZ
MHRATELVLAFKYGAALMNIDQFLGKITLVEARRKSNDSCGMRVTLAEEAEEQSELQCRAAAAAAAGSSCKFSPTSPSPGGRGELEKDVIMGVKGE